MKKKEISSILLTGATGFVGRRLAPKLAAFAPGAHLYALGQADAPVGWRAAHIDITDERELFSFIERSRPDLVVHLAAQSSVGVKVSAEMTWRTNVVGTINLAAGVNRHVPEAIVLFTSTSEVYGDSFNDGLVSEDTPLRPGSIYAKTKVAAEHALGDILGPSSRLIVTRAFNHSGPGQDERFVLPSFAGQIARIEAGKQDPVIHVGNLDAERDFLHVDDVCDAYVGLIAAGDKLPSYSIFNVSSGSAVALRVVLDELRSLSSAKFEIFQDPTRLRLNDIARASGSFSRIAATIGWKPSIPRRVVLEQLLSEARANCREADARHNG